MHTSIRSNMNSSHGLLRPQPEFISDEAQLPLVPPERPDLRNLNTSLEALAAVFPDVQPDVFRELLTSFDGESRLALVADALLKNRMAWVKGRWRTPGDGHTAGAVPRADAFRSPEYIRAVRALAWHEFRGLPRSAMDAALAESNHSYLDARPTLVALASKSWRFGISSFLLRRKPVGAAEARRHPLVVWRPGGVPAIRTTGSAELDAELFDALVRPLQRREREDREARDQQLAARLNSDEAEQAGATHECACCFVVGAFEDFTSCSRRGHMLCCSCVRRAVHEALFGQGWLSSIDAETGTLRCLAADGDGCGGHVPPDDMRRALTADGDRAGLLRRLDERLAEHGLAASGLPLVRCPFCSYAEVDDVYVASRIRIRADTPWRLLLAAACAAALVLTVPAALVWAFGAALAGCRATTPWRRLAAEWEAAILRHCRRRRDLRFACREPRCGRASCLACQKAWNDVHVCHESSLVALRTQVEQAMSMAVKRVCPRCSMSFVKSAGCNKLACPCGYKMCYVCRADLGDEGYRHFCDHFRPDGDARPCRECDRCSLWEAEDVDAVLRRARDDAERRWRESEKRGLSGAERAYLETGVAAGGARPGAGIGRRLLAGEWTPGLADCLDAVIDVLYV